MRDSNYKSISGNKAAVTITTSLYDRRALDVTSDKPLVNSLNHLTYLVSSSAKVRETLSNDGGIERLIEILHECHNSNFNTEDNIFNSERKLLTAWKWTLAFQCLVLIGTRGTEKIRQKVVKAGMLPIIATVLDNYLTLHERTFLHANVRPNGQSETSIQDSYTRPTSTHLTPTPEEPSQTNRQTPHQLRPQVNNPQQANLQHNLNETHRHQEAPSRSAHSQLPNRAHTNAFAPLDEGRAEQNRNFMFNQHSQADTAPATASPSFTEVEVGTQPIFDPNAAQIFTNTNTDTSNIEATREGQTLTDSAFNSLNNNTTTNFLSQIDSFSNAAMSQSIASETAGMNPNSTATIPGSSARGPTFFQNNHSDSLTSDDYDSLTIQQLFKLIHVNGITQSCNSAVNGGCTNKSLANNDIKRRYLIVNIIKKLREEKQDDLLDDKFFNDCDYEMDNGLQFLSDMYLQEDRNIHLGNVVTSKSAPRNFTETGVVIPRDDDIVWSLQLLAYISKYPHLKEILQNTHLVIDMSIRDKQVKLYLEKQMKCMVKKKQKVQARPTIIPRSRKAKLFNERHASVDPNSPAIGSRNVIHRNSHVSNATTGVRFLDGNASTGNYLERFNLSASNSPQMLNDINNIQNDNFILDEDKLDLGNKPDLNDLIEDAEAADDDEDDEDDEFGHHSYDKKDDRFATDDDDDEYLSSLAGANIKEVSTSYLSKLYDSIIDAESIVNDLDREIALFHISDSINRYVEIECKKLSNTIISKRLDQKQYLEEKWNYDTYSDFEIDGDECGMRDSFNSDFDNSLIEYKKVNLFPIVEKFTFLAGTDMYYWSGVIMRNSCRRNDSKGGVRQCGNLECGRWEKFPREFSKCRRCKRTKYCSRECQMKAWHCHRNWCVPSGSSSNNSATAASSTSTNYEAPNNSVGANGANGLTADGTIPNQLFATTNGTGDSRGDEGPGTDMQPSTSANNSD